MKRRKRPRRHDSRPARALQTIPGRVEQALELPAGSLSQLARIELAGNRCAAVEGCRGIVEYTEDCVRLDIGDAIVRFTGRDLTVSNLTEDSAVIRGIFVAIEYV